MFAEEINEEKQEKKDVSAEQIKETPEKVDESKSEDAAEPAIERNDVIKDEKTVETSDKSDITPEKKVKADKDAEKDASVEKIVKEVKKDLPEDAEIPSEQSDADAAKSQEVSSKSGAGQTKKEIKIDEPRKSRTESGRFEKRRTERKRIDRRGLRQGIRREEYRNKSYDALPARDQNIKEILNTGNPDVINRTAEDYAKTWGDRPPWVKNRFSSFQIRPIFSKIQRIRKQEFANENVAELKLLKPLIAYIARRYH
ncbi:MAG: hypothetical protein K8S87_05160, partial [Planctomycetes bacterium]|nr:hypothetical protein [Planctomycetota bacterium]